MEWYRFDENTKEYLQPVKCQANPRGGFLIPFSATPDAPPALDDNEIPVWDGKQWQAQEDHRNKTVYNKTDKTELEIKDLGPIPDTHTETKPEWFEVWENNQWTADIAQLKQAKLGEINGWADQQLAAITSTYPQTEMQSWDQQHHEAHNIVDGGTGSTYLIDAMATARDIDRKALAEKILEKAHAFETLSGGVFGCRQKLEDQLSQATTQEQIEAINLPE